MESSNVNIGFKKVDSVIAPLIGGCLYIIGGRPSIGKTSFITNIATYNSFVKNNKVIAYTLQYTKDEFEQRMLCSISHIDTFAYCRGFTDDEIRQMQYNCNTIGEDKFKNLIIVDTPHLTIETIEENSLSESNVKLIIIDYLQLIESEKTFPDRRPELDYILRHLKQLAKKLNVPIIINSTLTRECENRLDKRPRLIDLRDTGSIEDIADVVMFIYRDEYYNYDTEDKNIAEIIIAKNSMGRVGYTKLAWLAPYLLFGNLQDQ